MTEPMTQDDMSAPPPGASSARLVKAPRELAAGIFLLALALIGYLAATPLSSGSLSAIGPGLMPKYAAVLVAAFGIFLVAEGLTFIGERLEAWSLRGMVLVLGAVCVFAATIKPIGLAVAGPLAVIISAFADRETRIVEIAAFAAVLTVLSVVMFKFVLRLPIPILTPILGY